MSNEVMERPPLKLVLEDSRVIKMTYGHEMDLRRLLPDPTTAMQLVMNDPFTQDYVVRRCLSPVKKMFEDLKEVPEVEDDDQPSTDDVERILLWAVSHVLYFFMKRATAMGELAAQYQMTPLNPSKTGSESSASTTPSVGHLE